MSDKVKKVVDRLLGEDFSRVEMRRIHSALDTIKFQVDELLTPFDRAYEEREDPASPFELVDRDTWRYHVAMIRDAAAILESALNYWKSPST